MHLRRPPTAHHRRSARRARRAAGHRRGRTSGGHRRGRTSGGHRRGRSSDGRCADRALDRARAAADAHARHLRGRRREPVRGRSRRLRARLPLVLSLELPGGRRVRGEAHPRRRRREAPRSASSAAEVHPEEHRLRLESLLRGWRSRAREGGQRRERGGRRRGQIARTVHVGVHARARDSRGCDIARTRCERDARSLARPIERPRETNTP